MGMFTPKYKSVTAEEYIERHQLHGLENQQVIRKIAEQMAGSRLMKDTMSTTTDINLVTQVLYYETLVEQNWLILKQLEKLNNR